MNAIETIEALGLEPLTIEGGFFKEIYRSKFMTQNKSRTCGTSIYYLMTVRDVSSWHKVTSDEIWYFHGGSPAVQLLIYPDGSMDKRIIGLDIAAGQVPQSLIPANTWQAAVLLEKDENVWGLFGASVFPGFEYEDFTGATVEQMLKEFPHLKETIINFFDI
jgi:uncharacterized protein